MEGGAGGVRETQAERDRDRDRGTPTGRDTKRESEYLSDLSVAFVHGLPTHIGGERRKRDDLVAKYVVKQRAVVVCL
eukprot:COSAG03_NODE_2876_length_2379_cov_26.549912_2_plen_77_part_00